jgi:hypothetical protein
MLSVPTLMTWFSGGISYLGSQELLNVELPRRVDELFRCLGPFEKLDSAETCVASCIASFKASDAPSHGRACDLQSGRMVSQRAQGEVCLLRWRGVLSSCGWNARWARRQIGATDGVGP